MEKLSYHGRALKVHVDPTGNTVMVRSVKLSTANSSKAPTWRASYRCWMTGNSSWVTRDDGWWTSAYAELDGERRDNNLYWFGPPE